MKRKIYLASSWRNNQQPELVVQLRREGYDVYDFRKPVENDSGFSWSEIDPNWRKWSVSQFKAALDHPFSDRGFGFGFEAMKWADTFVLLLPSGRSAHIEAGWAMGARIPTFILMPEGEEPELMYRMASGIATDNIQLFKMLRFRY